MAEDSVVNRQSEIERVAHENAIKMKDPVQESKEKERIRENIREGSSFDTVYIVMNMLATIVACYGLFADSAAVVIGAMIIAMLLGPIAGVALGLVDGDNSILKKALFALIGGVFVVLGTAFVIGSFHSDIPVTREIMARTAPNFLDLMIALAGGAAGAYAVTSPRLSVAFVGVAIATALVPPLSSCSILLARGEYKLAGGAFLLAFTNIIAIQFASSLVLWISGYHRIFRKSQFGSNVLLRNTISIAILVTLSVVLVANLRHVVSKLLFEANINKTMSLLLKAYPGSHLAEVRFSLENGKTIVRAVVRGPKLFSPEQVREMENQLPNPSNGSRPELRLRFVETIVMTKDGPLYSADEALMGASNKQ